MVLGTLAALCKASAPLHGGVRWNPWPAVSNDWLRVYSRLHSIIGTVRNSKDPWTDDPNSCRVEGREEQAVSTPPFWKHSVIDRTVVYRHEMSQKVFWAMRSARERVGWLGETWSGLACPLCTVGRIFMEKEGFLMDHGGFWEPGFISFLLLCNQLPLI